MLKLRCLVRRCRSNMRFLMHIIAAEGSILIFTVFLWYPVLLAELYRVDVISIFALIQGGPGGGAIILEIFTEWYVTCETERLKHVALSVFIQIHSVAPKNIHCRY